MKILHTADTHLGDLTGPTKDGKNLRRLDTLACMDAIVKTAEQEAPNVIIIAGDLFNRARVWADTALEDVNDAVTRFIRPLCWASEAVVLLFGTENHDNPRAFETLTEITKNEKNLHIYTKPAVETIETEAGPIQIMAVPGFDKGRLRLFCPGVDKEDENRNATALVNDVVLGLATQLDHSKPAVMVAHYTVSGSEADNGSTFLAGQDVVILPATIDAANIDLACFGHIHRPQRIGSNTPAYYCGSPNQLNFNDEDAAHGFYIHELDGGAVKSSFINTPERRHYTYRMGPEDVTEFIRSGDLGREPVELTDAIVRVRYSCTSEQEKAFNRAELQKALMGAGVFYVAEVLPEDVEELDAKDQLTEHDGPAECLARWLELNEVTGQDADRLMELAAPIIKQADDGRDTDKHTGAFVPLTIEVKNYRSYTDAYFDFEPVHMAMVNGHNGVGKSSLFMDAIADCLYEQTRKEDVGGWVRDGTKSGAITFTFQMGGQSYRVIRTRTKSGRGTLALQRFNQETEAWEDESDTTMPLTQKRLVALLGMDCNTFCSIALIRQDAYGLFLEADSDRRMEVLSALLGLEIYGRMEEIAKAGATDQRRKIAATKERINILAEQIEAKAQLEADDEALATKAKATDEAIAATEAALKTAEQADAMRAELLKQADEKDDLAREYGQQAIQKEAAAATAERKLEDARKLSAAAPAAQRAADAVKAARAKLEELAPAEEKLRSLTQTAETQRRAAQDAVRRLQEIAATRDSLTAIVAQKAEIEAAQKAIADLAPDKEDAQRRMAESAKTTAAVKAAKEARDAFLADSRVRIGAIDAELKQAQQEAGRLTESGCPVPDNATCKFLSAATASKKAIPDIEKRLADTKAADKARYEELDAAFKVARDADDALLDPVAEIMEIAEKERKHSAKAALAPKLAAAEAKLEELEAAAETARAAQKDAVDQLAAIEARLPELQEKHMAAEAARMAVRDNGPLADTLTQCNAAAATADALAPQAEELRREAEELKQRQASAVIDATAIKGRIPEDDAAVTAALRDRLKGQRQTLNDIATERGAIKAKMDSIAEAERQTGILRHEVEEIALVLNDYTTLVQAFGLDGIQYMIIRGVVPEIMHRSNDILAAMTGGRMAVDIRTEKEQRSTKQVVNSLEVWIASIAGSNRPYQSHSGGEKVKIALAVTLGLADVKARRAGVQLGMLFIDEPPFLDADGTEAYADALTNMAARNPGMRILAISHDPTMKARFSQNITVSAGEDGSTVTME